MKNRPLSLRQAAQLAPKFIRHPLMRRLLELPGALPRELSFRVATTQEDLEAAYRIVHDCYVEMGYARPDPTGLRLTKYFALPTTTTLLACWRDKVIGTLSLIRQGPFGLPIEKAFDLKEINQRGWAIGEVSALAITPEFRLSRGQVFLPLCKFLYDYARFYMNLDAVVIAVNPSWVDFYEALLMFKPLAAKTIENYEFANGAPAVGMIWDLAQSKSDFARCFTHLNSRHDLHRFFVIEDAQRAQFPSRPFFKAQDPVMTAAMIEYFFSKLSPILDGLNESERLYLGSIYRLPDIARLIHPVSLLGPMSLSREARFQTRLLGFFERASVEIANVSRSGLQVRSPVSIPQRGRLALRLGPTAISHLEVERVWHKVSQPLRGLKICSADANWQTYIDYLQADLERLPIPDRRAA